MAVSKVILNGTTLIDTTDKTVTAGSMLNGVTALKNDGTTATGSIVSKSSADLTASGATVTAPAGYYASAASKSVVSGTAGTPTATKGTVSNNSVSVTPSVTNTTGYISGGTKNGTAVTVSASELVSGTKSITENGTGIDVTNFASVDVAVESGGGGEAWGGTVTVVNKLTAAISSLGYLDQNSASTQVVSLAKNQSVTFAAPLDTHAYGHGSVQYVSAMFYAYIPSAYYSETPTVVEDGHKIAIGKSAASGNCYHFIKTIPDISYGANQTSVTIEIAMP